VSKDECRPIFRQYATSLRYCLILHRFFAAINTSHMTLFEVSIYRHFSTALCQAIICDWQSTTTFSQNNFSYTTRLMLLLLVVMSVFCLHLKPIDRTLWRQPCWRRLMTLVRRRRVWYETDRWPTAAQFVD